MWTQADVDKLKAAIAGGVLEVEYEGPPRRRVRYQDLGAMRSLLASMRAEVGAAPTHRLVKFRKGLR